MKFLPLAIALVVFAAVGEAHAQRLGGPGVVGGAGPFGGRFGDPLRGGYFNIGAPMPGQAYGFSFPGQNLQDRMPHFALFPPVYYSVPVPRTYGYSPFAYPGFVPSPEVAFAEPQVMANPYMNETQPTRPAPSKQEKTPAGPPKSSQYPKSPNDKIGGVQPLRSLNPFFGEQFVETK